MDSTSPGNLITRRSRGWRCLCAAVLLLSFGCTSSHPYRTVVPAQPLACEDSNGTQSISCASTSWEHHAAPYDLLYAEFDDQGLIHPKGEPDSGQASQQVEAIDQALRETYDGRCLNLVVYAHGWKHNAKTDDSDVLNFRDLLTSISTLESIAPDPHRVVGIFVSWRGLSATVEPFKEGSFWSRKNAANRVAEGSARELFSRLRAYQKQANSSWDKTKSSPCAPSGSIATPPSGAATPRPPVRMLIIGHSFGGQIVYNSIEPYLTESLAAAADAPDTSVHRYGDMVIVVNSAFEAARFAPLYALATNGRPYDHSLATNGRCYDHALATNGRCYDHYQAPIFVSITSTADTATGFWFPFGRFFSTLFQHYSTPEERVANEHTIGHVDAYITHELRLNQAASRATCPGWMEIKKGVQDPATLRANVAIEGTAADLFFHEHAGHNGQPVFDKTWTRNFCGGAELSFKADPSQVDPNIPIWNVQTYKDIIPNHTDIEEQVLWAFVRQLYRDSMIYPTL